MTRDETLALLRRDIDSQLRDMNKGIAKRCARVRSPQDLTKDMLELFEAYNELYRQRVGYLGPTPIRQIVREIFVRIYTPRPTLVDVVFRVMGRFVRRDIADEMFGDALEVIATLGWLRRYRVVLTAVLMAIVHSIWESAFKGGKRRSN